MNERVNERVMEILNLVLQRIMMADKKCDEQELIENLLSKGYALSEIDAAFGLIFSAPEMLKPHTAEEPSRSDRGYRVFSLLERVKVSVPIQEQILLYRKWGLMSDSEMEMLLMEIMLSEKEEISLKDLNAILINVIKDENRLMMMLSSGTIGEKREVN